MSDIVIIDYDSGNLRSVMQALLAASEHKHVALTDDPQKIANASHLVLPGVGAFEACQRQLAQKPDTLAALQHAVREQAKPFLGICVGMQRVAERSLEYGTTQGLGWIKGEIRPLPPSADYVVPHMGWNNLHLETPHALFAPMADEDVYFAHSFALYDAEPHMIAAHCDYSTRFCAAIACDNMIGTQFHPEKSQQIGLAFLHRFLNWQP